MQSDFDKPVVLDHEQEEQLNEKSRRWHQIQSKRLVGFFLFEFCDVEFGVKFGSNIIFIVMPKNESSVLLMHRKKTCLQNMLERLSKIMVI